jgi:hypothetical protein
LDKANSQDVCCVADVIQGGGGGGPAFCHGDVSGKVGFCIMSTDINQVDACDNQESNIEEDVDNECPFFSVISICNRAYVQDVCCVPE